MRTGVVVSSEGSVRVGRERGSFESSGGISLENLMRLMNLVIALKTKLTIFPKLPFSMIYSLLVAFFRFYGLKLLSLY